MQFQMSKYINSLWKSNQVYKNRKFEYLLKGFYSFFTPFFFPFFLMSIKLYWSIQHFYCSFYLVISISMSFAICMWYSYPYLPFIIWHRIYDCFFIIEGVSFFKHVLNVIKWSYGRFYLNIHNTLCILRCTVLLLHFNVSKREIHTYWYW